MSLTKPTAALKRAKAKYGNLAQMAFNIKNRSEIIQSGFFMLSMQPN